MSKKGHTNNPGGRPVKRPEDKVLTPARQLGRVDDETWQLLQEAAQRAGIPFSKWAIGILTRAAKRQK